jgi:c-di-GMP-binding flagellar brake protein YcgR
LFSKKKTSISSSIAEFETSCRRESFRISDTSSDCVIANFSGIPIEIQDISAGGISFTSNFIEIGARGILCLTLSGKKKYYVEADIEVVSKSTEKTCHCRFKDISHENEEAIHQFVLEMQLKNKRSDGRL